MCERVTVLFVFRVLSLQSTEFLLTSKENMRRATHLLGKAFRETGLALDRAGLKAADSEIYHEPFARHRNLMNLYDKVHIVRPIMCFVES